MRHTWRFFDYHAHCEDCEWQLHSKNALGVAAQHHDRTGHTVAVEVAGCITYASDAYDAELRSTRPEKGKP